MPTNSAPATTTPIDYIEAARGNVPGYIASDKFGYNSTVGTSFEDIWDAGGTYSGWLTAASTVQVRSGGNAADTAAGAGAQKIIVSGLDENWAVAQEEITLAGASASSATTTTFIRVNRVYVSECGTYGGTNTGNIIVEDTTGSNILAVVGAGYSQSLMFLLTVPAGHEGHLQHIDIFEDSTKSTTIRIWQRQNADVTSGGMGAARIVRFIAGSTQGELRLTGDGLPTFPEKTDIWIDAKVSSGTEGVSVVGTGYFTTT